LELVAWRARHGTQGAHDSEPRMMRIVMRGSTNFAVAVLISRESCVQLVN
jgi:hypothetical protein